MKYAITTLILLGSLFAQTLNTLHHFPAQQPWGQLAMDASGNIYGTTWNGGKFNMGTIFELMPQSNGTWKDHGLYSFAGGLKGFSPMSGLTPDGQGGFYGTTAGEGTADGQGSVIFHMSLVNAKWIVKILVHMTNLPVFGPVSLDAKGNLYGTAGGGTNQSGTVFEIPTGTTKPVVLHSFSGADGAKPWGGVAIGPDGTLYGITVSGGTSNDGTVFSIAPDGTQKTLYNFSGADGREPYAGVYVVAQDGSIVGTTRQGGAFDCGTVWRLSQGILTTLYDFKGGLSDGAYPMAPLVVDQAGNIFGTTTYGMNNHKGNIFELSPGETSLYIFGGEYSSGGLMLDAAGNLYGADALKPHGSVFQLSGK